MVVSNGIKAALLPVLKSGNASTLDVVSRVLKSLPGIAATLPQDLQIKPLFDQSIFVSSALEEVVREGMIAGGLTALMILLFLGSWRSTLVVATSIPLSICTSVIAWSDDQYHDAGRFSVSSGDFGRRRHRRGRKHPP
jgi:multidrug efflux pump subunit AcrB